MTDITKQKVDEYITLSKRLTEIKTSMDDIKGWFEKRATEDLRDTKLKTIEYWGSQNAKVTVGNSETVKPQSMLMIKKVFGSIYDEFVTEEPCYKVSATFKRLLGLMFMGNYTEGSLDDVIASVSSDETVRATLRKKLRGKFEKDKSAFINIAGLPDREASDMAYLTAEVVNWEWMLQLLKAAEWSGTVNQAVDIIRSAVIVDEGIKVTLEND